MDASSAAALDVPWLLAALEPAGPYGQIAFDDLRPFVRGEEDAARARARRVAELAASLDAGTLDAVRETLRGMPDAAPAIARASIGDTLGDANLLELQRFCDAAARTATLLAGADVPEATNDAVRETARALEPGRSGKFGFYLADDFDARLAAARTATSRAQAEFDAASGRSRQRVAQALGREEISGGEFVVMRADLSGSLPPGVRVAREAATYVMCELELDEATLAAMRRRDEAAEAVAEAEEAARAALSGEIRARASALERAARALGEIDVLVAAARFAKRYGCSAADIENDAMLSFTQGRHLPLAAELEREGRAFTPVDVALHDVAALTGPNMGGKSVCLRTCGFIALCAAFGLPVPAEGARVSLFDEIAWLGIGSDASPDGELGGLLSSFAREVVRLRDVLERAPARTLALVDEFARTTTPREGKALVVSLVAELQRRGAVGLVATHLGGVAAEAGVRHFAVRGLRDVPARRPRESMHETLAALADTMDYTVVEVGPGDEPPGDAIALAALLGLDESLIARARESLKGA